MKVLIVGNGGREHALAWKINQSPLVSKIYCAPGNGGTSEIGENISIQADDINGLLEFAKNEEIGLTVVGPEVPLTMGIVDEFELKGLRAFGVNKKAAIMENSKLFSKDFMKKYNIPTAAYEKFYDAEKAKDYIRSKGAPIVVKADGLAAGKGAIVCNTVEEAVAAVDKIMVDKEFGAAGEKVVIEEFLDGEEGSFIAVTDGKTILPLATAQDHKAIYDGDKGPNTGGMGAYSPAPVLTEELIKEIMATVMEPTIAGMEKEGRPYKGILYAGIMMCNGKPKVLEFNVRMGDPETQPIMMRMESDIVELFQSVIDSTLDKYEIKWSDKAAACVVMSSEGYPGSYEKGKIINGLNECSENNSVVVFHAGTIEKDGNIVTSGGRVLGITALGDDIKASIENVYKIVSKISFDGAYYRKDIGRKAL